MLQPRPTLTRKPTCLFFGWLLWVFFPQAAYLCGWGFFSLSMSRGIFLFTLTTPNPGDCYQVWYLSSRSALPDQVNIASFHAIAEVQTDGSTHFPLDLMQYKWNCWEMCLSLTVATLVSGAFGKPVPDAALYSSSMPLTFTKGFLH